MESNFLTVVFLPLALFIIMLGMGLGLTLDDFKRVLVQPKGVIIGLIAQLIMLPVVGFFLATIFPVSSELALGVMILAACPGGSSSNMITYLVKGNVALSITLTAISSLITVFTIPLVVNLSMERFMGEAVGLRLSFLETTVQIAIITIIPISIGMLIHFYKPKLAFKVEKSVKWISLFFLGLIMVGLILKERDNVVSFFLQVGGVTLALNVLSMALGYGIAIFSQLDQPSSKSIAVEVGIQNCALAVTIATTLLNMSAAAIPAAIYALTMLATSGVFWGFVKRI